MVKLPIILHNCWLIKYRFSCTNKFTKLLSQMNQRFILINMYVKSTRMRREIIQLLSVNNWKCNVVMYFSCQLLYINRFHILRIIYQRKLPNNHHTSIKPLVVTSTTTLVIKWATEDPKLDYTYCPLGQFNPEIYMRFCNTIYSLELS